MALPATPWGASPLSPSSSRGEPELVLARADDSKADVEAGEMHEEGDLDDETKPLAPKRTEADERAETLDTRGPDILSMALNKLTFAKPPEIHDYPAPPAVPTYGDPTLEHPRIPTQAHVGLRQSYLDRFLNSSSGRFTLFATSIFLLNISIWGLVRYNLPEYRESGWSFYHWCWSLTLYLLNFTLPLLAERGGMSSKETGWKPWLILYRFSFLLAIPACVCQLFGNGEEAAFGRQVGVMGKTEIKKMSSDAGSGNYLKSPELKYWDYFELIDGFVSLNLTKGVTETRAPQEHGVDAHRRFSRFIDAELRINTEPFSDEPEPTETPGRLATYRIAPVFANWDACLTRYRISTGCLRRNPVRAWAVSKSTSLCASYKSVACRPPKPKLKPVYKCSTDRVEAEKANGAIEGLCGHVTMPPPDGAIDELSALLLYDAWGKNTLPKADSLWLDVSPDECIDNQAKCKDSWNSYYLGGFVCQIAANIFIVMTLILDCKVDLKIREARKIVEQEHHKLIYGNGDAGEEKDAKKKKKSKKKKTEG